LYPDDSKNKRDFPFRGGDRGSDEKNDEVTLSRLLVYL
jgi:hypothetical protein